MGLVDFCIFYLWWLCVVLTHWGASLRVFDSSLNVNLPLKIAAPHMVNLFGWDTADCDVVYCWVWFCGGNFSCQLICICMKSAPPLPFLLSLSPPRAREFHDTGFNTVVVLIALYWWNCDVCYGCSAKLLAYILRCGCCEFHVGDTKISMGIDVCWWYLYGLTIFLPFSCTVLQYYVEWVFVGSADC